MVEHHKAPPQFPVDMTRRVVPIPGRRRAENPGSETAKKLVVGRDITLAGEIADCDILVVEGKVTASLRGSQRIEIAETGVFEGNLEIDVAEIKGRFDGELVARDRLIIRRTGQVSGRIRYGEIEIERGGRIEGDIEVTDTASTLHDTDASIAHESDLPA
jgi:cytoskeletal protein CcmA (bactofilin family)